jgi:RHS repeat-associated protein
VAGNDSNTVRVARLDKANNKWVSVGNGVLNGCVYAITAVGDDIYIGGSFTNAGGDNAANYIARLVSGTWTHVGSGIQSRFSDSGEPDIGIHYIRRKYDEMLYGVPAVLTLAACQTNLFVGGSFTSAGGNTNANGIAIWNGFEWSTIGAGVGMSSMHFSSLGVPDVPVTNIVVTTITPHGDRVFVGGQFTNVYNDGMRPVAANNIATALWDANSRTWTWSDLDQGTTSHYSALPGQPANTLWNEWGGMVTSSLVAEGDKPGQYDLYIGGFFHDVGVAQLFTSGLARWRFGYANTNTAPIVIITSPGSPTVLTNPAVVLLSGTAFASSTNILGADFYANTDEAGSPITICDGSTNIFAFTNAWTNPPVGEYLIYAVANDDNQMIGRSSPILLNIKSTNGSVTAFDDSFTLPENALSATLPVLTNDLPTTGLHISQITMLHNNFGKATISADGTSIVYRAYPNVAGTDIFYYAVTNAAGIVDSASVTVNIAASPIVSVTAPDSDTFVTNASSNIGVSASASSWTGVITNTAVYINGASVGQNATNYVNANWATNLPGFYTLTASAVDNSGLVSTSAPVILVITNATSTTNILTASITNLPSLRNDLGKDGFTVVSNGLFDLQGSALDSNTNDSVFYQVLVHPFGDEDTILADVTPAPVDATGFHRGAVNNGDLGTNDFSRLQNGIYDLELVVRGGASQTNAVATFRLETDLKIGQFSFSEQDLVLPVNGIPITVTRTYNSLNPESGPFGASWSFALNDMDVQLYEQRQDMVIDQNAYFGDPSEGDPSQPLPSVANIRLGGSWDVTLTLPDGRRVTYPFNYSGFWPDFSVWWDKPPGVTATLQLIGSDNLQMAADNVFGLSWHDSDSLFGPQPYQYSDLQGWILTTEDKTQYKITRGEATNIVCMDPAGSQNPISARVYGRPKLTEIDEVSGNKTLIKDTGIFNYDPTGALTRWTLFDRDEAGRIKALRDPNGGSNGVPLVVYVYNDETGNLVQVLKLVDRAAGTYTTNKYYYDYVKFPHYITSIENGDGILVARNNYDDSGRLTSVLDANGTLTQFSHDLTHSNEIVVDRLNHTNSYVYDSKGNVIWATNALGTVTATAYNDPNNSSLETAVTNAYGTAQATWTVFTYDQYGNQNSVVSMGHTNSFQYDNTGNLLMEVDPLGNTTRNIYDGAGNLTNTTQYDASNNPVTSSSSVYTNGKLVMTLNAYSQTNATFGYDQFGNLTNTTDASGFSHGFSYDANGNQTASSYRWTPPGGGSAVPVTTTTLYDAQNRVIQTIDALGNTNRTFYNALGKVDYAIDKFGNTNSFIYDALGNVIQTTYPNNTSTRTVYDAAGRAYLTGDRNGVTGTRTDYDAAGRATNTVRLTNVVISIQYSGSVPQSVVTSAGVSISTNSTVYDAAGKVMSRTSPDGTTSYDYYPDGQLMHVVDALNQTNFYAYDVAGHQTNVVDALNHSTQFKYDAVGRMFAAIYNDNTGTTNIFDALGQRTNVIDQAGLTTQFGYNVSGQLTNVIKPGVIDPDDSGHTNQPIWSYLYDSYGRPTVTVDPKGHGSTNFFDAYGRQISQRLTLNQTNLTLFNGLGQTATSYDFKGQRTELYYDRFGRVTNKFYFLPSSSHPSNSVSYAYNRFDQLTNIIERYNGDADAIYAANNVEPEPRYFAKALTLVAQTAPKWGASMVVLSLFWLLLNLPLGRKLRNVLAWYYLGGGWRLKVAAVRDRRTRYVRLPSYFWRTVTLVTLCVLIVDDPAWDNMFAARASCDIPGTDSTLTKRTTNFSYDAEGRLMQVNAPEGVINYTYDLATGRLHSTCTGNSAWDYMYDALGRLHTLHVSQRAGTNVNETNTYTYDAVGNRNSVTFPTGVVTTNLYDGLNRLTNITHRFGTTNLATYSYKLDQTGRRTNAVEILREEDNTYLTNTLSWKFDGLYRLTNEVSVTTSTGAPYAYTNNYTYNLAGNRLHKVRTGGDAETIDYGYDASDELLYETNGTTITSYLYDANGSVTNRAIGTTNFNYAYDLKNKLSSLGTNGTVQASYQYNDQGIRVRATSGGTTNYYLVDANNCTGYQQILEEYASLRGSPTKSYVVGDDVLAQTASGTVSYLLYDGHGSARQVFSGITGAVTSRYNYDAYGVMQSTSSASPDTSLLYCGEQYDSMLGMYNLRARYYNAGNGRFNQRDTLAGNNEDPQSLHKYLYCRDEPCNRVDPSGLGDWTLVGTMLKTGIITGLITAIIVGIDSALGGKDAKGIAFDAATGFLVGFSVGALAVLIGPVALARIAPYIPYLLLLLGGWGAYDSFSHGLIAQGIFRVIVTIVTVGMANAAVRGKAFQFAKFLWGKVFPTGTPGPSVASVPGSSLPANGDRAALYVRSTKQFVVGGPSDLHIDVYTKGNLSGVVRSASEDVIGGFAEFENGQLARFTSGGSFSGTPALATEARAAVAITTATGVSSQTAPIIIVPPPASKLSSGGDDNDDGL